VDTTSAPAGISATWKGALRLVPYAALTFSINRLEHTAIPPAALLVALGRACRQ
jgi:hypothetical protein